MERAFFCLVDGCNLLRMRILHISSAVNYGGGEKHIVDLCRGLTERGHEAFVALRPTNKWQSRLDFFSEENVLHVSIRNSFGVFSARRIGEFVREKEIDIIHAHVARDYIPASIACMASKRARFVLTRHVLFPLKPFNRFALRNLSRAVGVSAAVSETLSNVFPKEKIRTISNGIEFKPLTGSDRERARNDFRIFHDIPGDVPLIGTVGELTPLKGQRDLVLAAIEVAKKHPSAIFIIVGLDNSAGGKYRRELKRLVRVLGLELRFKWLDWADDLPAFLSAIDIYVSPSHTESFGLATLEAMAAGTAVVATRTEGSRELLRDDGLLVPIDDPVAMATHISELINDADHRQQLGNELMLRAAEEFSLEKMVGSVESLYREILLD
jgi:glycosyltransferase involved in cell wall biosynthesis